MLKPESKQAVSNFFAAAETEFNAFLKARSPEEYEAAAQLILDSQAKGGRLHVTGIGKCSHVSTYAASLFSSTGNPAYYLHGTEAVPGSCGQLAAGDVVIAISNSGETAELKATVLAVQNNGCKVIGVSGNPNSWLAKHTDAFLFAGVKAEGGPLNRAPPQLRAGGAAHPSGPLCGAPGGEGLGPRQIRPLPPRRKAGRAAGERKVNIPGRAPSPPEKK